MVAPFIRFYDIDRQGVSVGGVTRTQTGMSNPAGDFTAGDVRVLGTTDSASMYTVALLTTPTDLCPEVLVGATHLAITNVGTGALYIGGPDVTSTNGIQLSANATYTMDGVNRRFKVYATKLGVPTQTAAVMRW
jgi:hypothetical protein